VNHVLFILFEQKAAVSKCFMLTRILVASQLHPSRPLITMTSQQKWATKESSCLAIPCQWESKPPQTKEATATTISEG
jgi:hypothetical protein